MEGAKENCDPDLNDFRSPKKKQRFSAPTTDKDMEEITKGYIPVNTQKSTKWAFNVFTEWVAQRNLHVHSSKDQCPVDLLEKPNEPQLNFWLSRFVSEVRKKDGSPYPPRSIHLILSALQRTMLETTPDATKFFDRISAVFRDLQRACDTIYRKLRSDGIGTKVRHTQTFTLVEENKLWDTNVLGINCPKSLQRAVFFYIGKIFCIRGGEEQRKLGPSQLKRSYNPDCYTYVEHGSKNRSGGLNQLKVENKCVPCFSVPGQSPRCLVFLLDMYLEKLPLFAFEKDILYCRPKSHVPIVDQTTWYEAVAVGKNKLGSMVKEICIEAGINVKTNHSLRATGATAMFQSNVPEKIIQNTTGHRSLESLRVYETASDEQQQAVSKILMSTKPMSYQDNQVSSKESFHVEGSSTRSSFDIESGLKSIFSNLSDCSIGTINLNINADIGSTQKKVIKETY